LAFVALLDANVLYPAYLRDALLRLAEAEVYQVRWSRQILEEMACNVLENNPDLPEENMERLVRTMEGAFPEAMVTGHEPLIPSMTNDPKDRHVLAAAIRGRADVIVTSNVRDFPPEACEPYDVAVQTPDEFLSNQWEIEDPDYLLMVFEDWVSHLKSPPLMLEELLEKLARVAPNFSEMVLEAARDRITER
jgi:predicted nucleic acid-binding protein